MALLITLTFPYLFEVPDLITERAEELGRKGIVDTAVFMIFLQTIMFIIATCACVTIVANLSKINSKASLLRFYRYSNHS